MSEWHVCEGGEFPTCQNCHQPNENWPMTWRRRPMQMRCRHFNVYLELIWLQLELELEDSNCKLQTEVESCRVLLAVVNTLAKEGPIDVAIWLHQYTVMNHKSAQPTYSSRLAHFTFIQRCHLLPSAAKYQAAIQSINREMSKRPL